MLYLLDDNILTVRKLQSVSRAKRYRVRSTPFAVPGTDVSASQPLQRSVYARKHDIFLPWRSAKI